MSNAINPERVMPDDVSRQCFSYLEASELASCCQVSKSWRRLASGNRVWALIARQMFNGGIPNVPNIRAFLQELASQRLATNQGIIDRLQAFINRISLGQNAKFTCHIRPGPLYQVFSVEIKGNENNCTELDFTDDCLAINSIGIATLARSDLLPIYRSNSQTCSSGLDRHTMTHISIFTAPIMGPFQATFRFPIVLFREYRTDMEYKIKEMIKIKLDQLAGQAKCNKECDICVEAVVVALGAYFSARI